MGRFANNTALMLGKELSGYFGSPLAYIVLFAFLSGSAANLVWFQGFFEVGLASLRPFFEWMPWVFLVLVPPLTMRIWTEERREGTIELLFTLPLQQSEILIGKFLAAWTFLLVALALTLPIPLSVGAVSTLDWGPVLGGYLGSALLGAAYLAIGMCASALSKNQILSFVLAVMGCLFFLGIGSTAVTTLSDFAMSAGQMLGFVPHFANVSKGVIDSRDFVYFGGLVFFFLTVNYYLIGAYRYA